MIVVMKPGATAENLSAVVKKIESAGLRTHLSKGEEVTIVGESRTANDGGRR